MYENNFQPPAHSLFDLDYIYMYILASSIREKTAMPQFSCIMAIGEDDKNISSTIESITKQSLKDFEFVIVTDSSDKNIREVLRTYANMDKRITVIASKKPVGRQNCLNKAMSDSKGNLIALISPGNIYKPEYLSTCDTILESGNDIVTLASATEQQNANILGGGVSSGGNFAWRTSFAANKHISFNHPNEILAEDIFAQNLRKTGKSQSVNSDLVTQAQLSQEKRKQIAKSRAQIAVQNLLQLVPDASLFDQDIIYTMAGGKGAIVWSFERVANSLRKVFAANKQHRIYEQEQLITTLCESAKEYATLTGNKDDVTKYRSFIREYKTLWGSFKDK